MLTRRPIGSVAGAERDLAQAEVVSELGPFDVGRFAVLLARATGPPLVHEASVVADHLLRIDRDIPLGRIEVEVSEKFRGDVDRQPAVHGFGGEDPAEVVGGEPQRGPVDVHDGRPDGQIGQQAADPRGRDDVESMLVGALEQVRQGRPEGPFVAVVARQQRHVSVGALDAAQDAGQHCDEVGVGGHDPFPVGLGRADLQQRHHVSGGGPVLAQAQVGELEEFLDPDAGAP